MKPQGTTNNKSRFGRSIKSQLFLIFMALVIAPTVYLGVLIYRNSSGIERQQLDENLTITTRSWGQVAEALQDQTDKVLKREDALIKQKLEALSDSLIDQLDVQHTLVGGAVLRTGSPVTQKISSLAIGRSGFAFVLDRQGKYIASKDNQFNGQTIQDHLAATDKATISDLLAHPEKLTAAGAYEARYEFAPDSNDDYRDQLTILSYYAPWDVVVGVSSYYTDFLSDDYEKSLQDGLRTKLGEQVIGSKGNIWVINSKGDYIVSRNHLQDWENILDYQDASGQPFIKDLVARAKNLNKEESFIVKYDWKELEEKTTSTRLAAVTYFPQWDWIIASSVYYSDYEASLQSLQRYIALVCLVFVGISSIAAYYFSRYITKPISKLQTLAVAAAEGHLDIPVDQMILRSRNEVGSLARSFQTMIKQLKHNFEKLQQEEAILEQRAHEIAAEHAKDEAILNSIGEGMIAVDATGHILKINQIALNTLGLEAQSILNKDLKTFLNLYDESDRPLPLKDSPLVKVLTSHQRLEKLYNVHRGDAKITVMFIVSPIIQNQEIIGAIMVLRDVTKEHAVDRMKTEFISLASHQLRTPLSAIKWYTEMLIAGDSGKLSAEQLEFATNVDDSTTRMIALVSGLLNISRIESGRLMIDPKPTDLHELVTGIVNDLKAKTEEKQQTLIINVHDDLPKINLDPHLISQVYLNLLTNAVKYTQKGGEVSVSISRKDDQIISQVTDNGYGIPFSQQGKLFQKFFRASNAVKVETDGTGLGLYLIKSVIESSGGKIWFKSEEGKGSTFWFSIPLSGMKAKKGEVTLDV